MTQTQPGPERVNEPNQAPNHRWQAPVGVGLGVAATAVALRLRDPHLTGSWGLCPLRALTGLDCPLCGGLRAVNDLTHADLSAAWFSNALFLISVPVLAVVWVWWLVASLTGKPAPSEHRWAKGFLWACAAVTMGFWVFRNTPWGSAYWA